MSRKAYTREERESIRDSMIRRSVRVFAEKGLRNASLEDVYVPEGISKTFFYTFFPSKSSLIAEVFSSQSSEMLDVLRKNVDIMSEEEFNAFKNDRIVLFADILNIIGVPVSRLDPRVFYNMLMSVVWTCYSHQSSMPFLYGEVARSSSDIQIERLVEYVSSLRVDSGVCDGH